MSSPDPVTLSPRKRQKLSPTDLSIPILPHAASVVEDQGDILSQNTISQIQDTAAMDAPPSAVVAVDESQFRRETKVGITERVNPDMPGFSGILKKRYTDFLVNEILPSGEVLHLTNVQAPRKAKPSAKPQQSAPPASEPVGGSAPEGSQHAEVEKTQSLQPEVVGEGPNNTIASEAADTVVKTVQGANGSAAPPFAISNEDEQELNDLFGPTCAQAILDLHTKILASPMVKARSFDRVKSPAITDRNLRTKIHQFVRRVFSSRLETGTDDDGIIVISAASSQRGWGANSNAPPNGRSIFPIKPKSSWNDLGGEYLHFSLLKENKDTMEVIAFISHQLRTPVKCFNFAGTKDRRAVTVQRVSAYRVHADRVVGVNRNLKGAKVGGYEYKPRGLALGELSGNEFVITLRDCQFTTGDGLVVANMSLEARLDAAKEIVQTALKSLKEKGFLNYFGLQRFGSFAARTDTIGVKMLQGDMKGACDEILSYNEALLAAPPEPGRRDRIASDDRARAEAIHAFRTTGSSQPALNILPRKFSAESALIRHLGHGADQQRANDYMGALGTITRNLRSMYGHAYQSLVWNVMVSERWELFGDKVVEGDLVLINEHTHKQTSDMIGAPATKAAEAGDVDESGEPIVLPSADDTAADLNERFERARPLSKEEAESGDYTIYDVVLPTPGFDILYPSNAMAEQYKSFMASERGGGLDPYDMRRKWKDVSLSGNYRKLITRPMGEGPIEFEVRPYEKDEEQLVETDLDKLQKPAKAWRDGFDKLEQSFAAEDKKMTPAGEATKDQVTEQTAPEAGKKLAVVLKLQLGTSQYATMALRELMGPGGVRTYKPDFGGGR